VRFLVTGGTGFIGQTLVEQLLTHGHEVVLLVREQYGNGRPLPMSIAQHRQSLHLVYGDLRNRQMTLRAVHKAGASHVIHLAAAGATSPFLPVSQALRHNVDGTINLMRACFGAGVNCDQMLVARTPGEMDALNVYATSKAAAWQFCRMFARTESWPVVGAKIFQAYGRNQPSSSLIPSALAAAASGMDFPMTSGQQQRDWVNVCDVASGLISISLSGVEPGSSLDLGTGMTNSVLQVVTLIYRLAAKGGRPRPGRLPDRPGEVPVYRADVTTTARATGWHPSNALSEGIRVLLDD
jgi:nucleoside-diphosphate-sugar epimerase